MAAGDVQDDLAGAVEAAGAVPVDLARRSSRPRSRPPRPAGAAGGRRRRRRPGCRASSATAQCGTAAVSPNSRQSPGRGASAKQSRSLPSARSEVRSTDRPRRCCWTTRYANPQGTTASSRSVAKTTASSLSVRTVATSVPTGQPDRLVQRRRQPEGDVGARGGRREEGDPDEVEEGEVVLLGDAVEPVDDLVGHVGDRLDERDAGVGHVVVGPLRGALLDVALGVVDELLEAAVVEVGGGQCHQRSLSVAGPGGVRRTARRGRG